jgi:plastocyanin
MPTAIKIGIGVTCLNNSGAAAPIVPSYSVSGPSTGVALAESTNFTVTGANLTGPVVVTPASDDPGGSFTPASVTIDVGDLVKTFKYTPDGSLGTHNLSWTNNGGLSDPAGIAYEVTAVPSGSAGEAIGLLLILTKAA